MFLLPVNDDAEENHGYQRYYKNNKELKIKTNFHKSIEISFVRSLTKSYLCSCDYSFIFLQGENIKDCFRYKVSKLVRKQASKQTECTTLNTMYVCVHQAILISSIRCKFIHCEICDVYRTSCFVCLCPCRTYIRAYI